MQSFEHMTYSYLKCFLNFVCRLKIGNNGEETWEFTGKYWEMKKNPGFANMSFEELW